MSRPALAAVVLAATVALVAPAATATAAHAAPSPKHGGSPPTTTTVPTPPAPVWGACDIPRLVREGAQCALLTVPLDYSHPHGKKIQLAISRVLHKTPDSQAQGPMLVNPGGPGGSGLIYAIFGDFVPNGAGDSYDWIGFDPRGVGESVPALSCDTHYNDPVRPDYRTVTRSQQKVWLAKAAGYADDCAHSAAAELLDHITTVDSAKDMESIRLALGASRLSLYGFSYGTYLGQVYATLFPSTVHRMVLDGNVDPRGVWYGDNLEQDKAFQITIRRWFAWVAQYDSVFHLGDTARKVEQAYNRAQNDLVGHPAGGQIGPAEWNDIFFDPGYYVYGWVEDAQAFSDWVTKHDPAGIIDLYSGNIGDDNGYAIYNAVQCTDAKWPPSWQTWKHDAYRINKFAPFATWANTWFNAPCLTWPAKAHKPVKVNGSRAPGILLVNETLDAATPYEGALEVRSRFPKSVLIEGVDGTTHAGSLSGVACTDDTIASYLVDGTLPARKAGRRSDLQCPPVPAPVPEAALSRVAAKSGSSLALRERLAPAVR